MKLVDSRSATSLLQRVEPDRRICIKIHASSAIYTVCTSGLSILLVLAIRYPP
ncbi:hypothetical protein PISMIDRAFT_155266 [Pisolithus microcarpus 441]|uniref:Uncharacterized protein n=1 Tax=Pisolithus microcarpus 441 TaxID=765257 RepID=A0A0C9ZH68_9AGAM|nr:hypothetical protein PISMIDRAFT_155266 [Pisolithus microcarpus 441]